MGYFFISPVFYPNPKSEAPHLYREILLQSHGKKYLPRQFTITF